MPKIIDIAGATIFVFPNDRPPPHVHVRHQGQAVRLRIADARLMNANPEFPARVLREARDWLTDNKDKAARLWAMYHS